jgi:hypothetical protein
MTDAAAQETARVSIDLAVDPLRAFTIFVEDVDQWWARGAKNRFRAPWVGIMRFEPGPNGRLVEIYDDETNDLYEIGRITIWEPGKRLAFNWRIPNFAPDEITHVDIRFEEINNGTRITLEHSGWDALRPDHPARHGLTGTAFRMMRSSWWADHLVAIAKHIEEKKP